jgi:hypothetical protein
MDANTFLTLDVGKRLAGVHVSHHKFQGVSCLDQLEDYGLERPSRLQKAKARDRLHDANLDHACVVRDAVQRRFDDDRVRRAEVYARYIEAVEYGTVLGGTPAITLYLIRAVQCLPEALVIPFSADLVAVDGETQTEARFMLRDDMGRPDSGRTPFAITVYHTVPETFGQQILHDYNAYAHPMTESKLAGLNAEGPLTKTAHRVLAEAFIPLEEISRFGKVPGKTQQLAQLQIMYAVIGFTMKETARAKDGAAWLKAMNGPLAQPLNGDGIPILVKLVKAGSQSPAARKCPLAVWQMAGVLAAEGRDVTRFNWEAAQQSIKGVRSVKTRLSTIAESL